MKHLRIRLWFDRAKLAGGPPDTDWGDVFHLMFHTDRGLRWPLQNLTVSHGKKYAVVYATFEKAADRREFERLFKLRKERHVYLKSPA